MQVAGRPVVSSRGFGAQHYVGVQSSQRPSLLPGSRSIVDSKEAQEAQCSQERASLLGLVKQTRGAWGLVVVSLVGHGGQQWELLVVMGSGVVCPPWLPTSSQLPVPRIPPTCTSCYLTCACCSVAGEGRGAVCGAAPVWHRQVSQGRTCTVIGAGHCSGAA